MPRDSIILVDRSQIIRIEIIIFRTRGICEQQRQYQFLELLQQYFSTDYKKSSKHMPTAGMMSTELL
jgi:hypothetical protein